MSCGQSLTISFAGSRDRLNGLPITSLLRGWTMGALPTSLLEMLVHDALIPGRGVRQLLGQGRTPNFMPLAKVDESFRPLV